MSQPDTHALHFGNLLNDTWPWLSIGNLKITPSNLDLTRLSRGSCKATIHWGSTLELLLHLVMTEDDPLTDHPDGRHRRTKVGI